MSFTLFDPEPADGAGPRPLDQLVDLLVAALAIPPHRGLDPGGQPARLGRARGRSPGRSASTIASCQAVIPSEWR